jgi:hypothetical protein
MFFNQFGEIADGLRGSGPASVWSPGLALELPCSRAWSEEMVLRLAREDVREVHKALSAAYSEVLCELSRLEGFPSRKPGIDLCHRKWKLEALLHQLDHSDDPPPVLELVTEGRRGALQGEAAA